jgi:hypothetical protein
MIPYIISNLWKEYDRMSCGNKPGRTSTFTSARNNTKMAPDRYFAQKTRAESISGNVASPDSRIRFLMKKTIAMSKGNNVELIIETIHRETLSLRKE